jgi:hypothetical protein
MNKSVPLVFAGVAWAVFATWAEARRSSSHPDDPALRSGIEADLAGRSCASLRLDTDRFRDFLRANHMNHADLYSRKRSASLQHDLDTATKLLHRQPDVVCARLWDKYGSAGTVVPLLATR